MAKIIVRGKKKDLRIPKGQFALVSKDKTATRAKIKREGKLEVVSVVNAGPGVHLFKLKKKRA